MIHRDHYLKIYLNFEPMKLYIFFNIFNTLFYFLFVIDSVSALKIFSDRSELEFSFSGTQNYLIVNEFVITHVEQAFSLFLAKFLGHLMFFQNFEVSSS